ncbi:hypothetical protein, partial [Bellilinea sp.]
PQYRVGDIGGGAEGGKSTKKWIIPNDHLSTPASCGLTVFDFEKAVWRARGFIYRMITLGGLEWDECGL